MTSINLTRQQIARIVNNDPEAIRALEALVSTAASGTGTASSNGTFEEATARVEAQSAAARAEAISGIAALAALAPANSPHAIGPTMADLAPAE